MKGSIVPTFYPNHNYSNLKPSLIFRMGGTLSALSSIESHKKSGKWPEICKVVIRCKEEEKEKFEELVTISNVFGQMHGHRDYNYLVQYVCN